MSKPSSRKPRKAPAKKKPSPKASRAGTTQRLTLAQAEQHTQQHPQQPKGWKALSARLMEAGRFEEALEASSQALALAPDDHEVFELLARTEIKLGNASNALERLKQALDIQPESAQAHFHLAKLLFDRSQNAEALEHIEQANRLLPNNNDVLSHKGNILNRLYRYDEAITVFDKLIKQQPEHYSHWNNAGNLRRDLGLLDDANIYYQKSIELAGASSALPFSNRLALLHYHPGYSRKEIFEVCKEWDARFAPSEIAARPQPNDKTPQRRIRIGMFSDGFRNHPVGRMIVAALENLEKHEIELYTYSTNNAVDPLTARIRATASQWLPIQHLSDEEFSQRIRDDEIDILIDLCGHNTGSRMRAMAQDPAPVLVKWVGGLINTTGLKAIDYLISDAIESPQGDDEFYTEKLIRMPDDYICYALPDKTPEVKHLPALCNKFITFGCFNNPTKVNDVLLAEWAELMRNLPDSRLFLKGHQYNSPELCDRIRNTMISHGITGERLIIEGPSRHFELLEAYNRVDIALDPWPYSGGLTTCEALLMGVPVVTLPGPTFAGRHSATHLTNAGMPELVTNSWDEYRQRAIELASDLQSLSTIRTHLRDIFLQSPVCDGPRFAKHFTTAMRAIWQRYCEDKPPAALTLNKQGEAHFEDEEHSVEILHPEPIEDEQSEFSWQFQGKITVIDNGAGLTSSPEATKLLKLGAFSMISFDPASKITNTEQLQAAGELHHYPHTVLGDGKLATLYACLDPAMSATLRPLSSIKTLTGEEEGPKVLAKLPVNTIQLDKIEGLEGIDWLILDNMNDSLAVLENGEKALANTLLIQARVNFQPTHENQPELTLISHWAARHGFSFYRLNDPTHLSHLPKHDDLVKQQATQLVSTNAIYIPNTERMAVLDDNQRIKLAFVLHTVYGINDLAYGLLSEVDTEQAEGYLRGERIITPHKKLINLSSISELINYLENTSLSSAPANHALPNSLVVSLTSYKARFENLHLTIRSLLLQNVSPDALVLWVAEEERSDLPRGVWELEQYGLSIRFCENIRSYKKIIPTLREYPDSFIVTADDDLYYQKDWLKGLIDSWDGNYKTVVAHRAHKIKFDSKGNPLPYHKWQWQVGPEEPADGLLFPTCGAGALYPPNVFHADVSHADRFIELCPTADDVWLYWMASLNDVKAKRSNYSFHLIEWPMTNPTALWMENIKEGENDKSFRKMLEAYGKRDARRLLSSENKFSVAGYWDRRYKMGGSSGAGSYGRLARFKAEVINEFVDRNSILNAIEFGCGDGNQLGLMASVNYLGVDVSPTAIEMCRAKYAKDSKKIFMVLDEFKSSSQTADMTLSLDVIYHLIDEEIFHDYMQRLFSSAKKYCIIYSANKEEITSSVHVRKRRFTDWIDVYAADWELAEFIPNRYPMTKESDPNNTSFADFYIFEKVI